jgi:hydroxymethylpyrimidine pyrophosphatase-like HAD family hydrolase
LNIQKKNIASIGDSINDIEMFDNSQIKFTMKKFKKEKETYSDMYFKIKSRKNAIAEAIDKYLLK